MEADNVLKSSNSIQEPSVSSSVDPNDGKAGVSSQPKPHKELDLSSNGVSCSDRTHNPDENETIMISLPGPKLRRLLTFGRLPGEYPLADQENQPPNPLKPKEPCKPSNLLNVAQIPEDGATELGTQEPADGNLYEKEMNTEPKKVLATSLPGPSTSRMSSDSPKIPK